jgi:hypothetical protein
MGTIHPFTQLQPFDPITCDAMGLAFDSAWQELLMSSTRLASSAYADATREALAKHIIDLAQRGERDVNRLRGDAVAFVLDALSLAQEPLALEPEAQSRADPVLAQSGSRIRRTTYWVGDKPVSLVYIPALADEHPETINDERAAPPLYHRRPTVPGGRLIEVKNPASPATKRDAEGIGWGR